MRKWRPPHATVQDECKVICQLVVQEEYRKAVVSLMHDSTMTEHLGVNKTSNGILARFYLPNIRRDVAENC
jgi:hypothetical protein